MARLTNHGEAMSNLIQHLRSFNRKERFILLSEALGRHRLGDGFRTRLGDAIGVKIPAAAYVAMDYHLDWLQMALYLADNPSPPRWIPKGDVLAEGQEDYNKNQMDVDLLVAFDQGSTTHLAMVEAKMDAGWANRQMWLKAKRLPSHLWGLARHRHRPSTLCARFSEAPTEAGCEWLAVLDEARRRADLDGAEATAQSSKGHPLRRGTGVPRQPASSCASTPEREASPPPATPSSWD